MVNIRYHHCAYASRASMAQRDNRSDMGCFRVICNVLGRTFRGYNLLIRFKGIVLKKGHGQKRRQVVIAQKDY